MRQRAVGKTFLRFLVLGALCAIPRSGGAALAAGPSYTFGVIPAGPPVAVHKAWTPFVERVQRESGVALSLKVYERMTDFDADINQGAVDFLFANPVQFTFARAAQGYVPLVRSGRPIVGVLFVREDSPVRGARDLAGKEIAFVGSVNVCSIFVRETLLQGDATRIDFKPLFTGSAANVFKTVELGKAAAGATLDVDMPAGATYRTILETKPVASHPLAAHPRVPASAREAVAAAVLALAGQPDGAALLNGLRLAEPVRADYARDYQPLVEMKLETLYGSGR